jgi:hypothetical protein
MARNKLSSYDSYIQIVVSGKIALSFVNEGNQEYLASFEINSMFKTVGCVTFSILSKLMLNFIETRIC